MRSERMEGAWHLTASVLSRSVSDSETQTASWQLRVGPGCWGRPCSAQLYFISEASFTPSSTNEYLVKEGPGIVKEDR